MFVRTKQRERKKSVWLPGGGAEKTTETVTYHQLVTNKRHGRNIRQKVIAHLGEHSTVEDALQAWVNTVAVCHYKLTEYEGLTAEAKAAIHPAILERNGGEVPPLRKRSRLPWQHPQRRYWRFREKLAVTYQRRIEELEERISHLCKVTGVGRPEPDLEGIKRDREEEKRWVARIAAGSSAF